MTKDLDIEEKNIQTDFMQLEPTYVQCNYRDEIKGQCNPLDIAYYTVEKGVQVTLNDLEAYEPLIMKALQLGITHIDNIQFMTTELRQHRDKVRDMAAKASEDKARALAKTLGMSLGKPVTINAQDYTVFYRAGRSGGRSGQMRMMQNSMQSASATGSQGGYGTSLALGQINITAKVHVTYELVE